MRSRGTEDPSNRIGLARPRGNRRVTAPWNSIAGLAVRTSKHPPLPDSGFAQMANWAHKSYQMDHGLVRVIADLYSGGQTDHAAARARGWLKHRSHFTTGFLFETLAERLKPLILVEKSPSIVHRAEFMRRALSMLPGARFLHLVSHPARYCEAVTEALREISARQPVQHGHWLMQLTIFPRHPPGETPAKAVPDPQVSWQVLPKGIADFLETVPAAQKLIVKGEDLLTNSDVRLMEVLTWLALRTDAMAVDEIRHPERSSFATHGPASASFGSDIFLVPGPMFRPAWVEPRSLDAPLSWRSDSQLFFPEIKELASQFGYE